MTPGRFRTAFALITIGLLCAVAAGITAAAGRNHRMWWDNLAGPDSSNFIDADQITKANVSQLQMAWFYPYATSGYDVMSTATRPPYTTLTAYDLNTGEIKWQVPNGDDPQTITRGGPTNTGGIGARHGMVVVKGGVVFHAGSSSGVPAGFEARGRQYVVLMTSAGGRGGGGGGGGRGAAPAPPTDPTIPQGAIAFALPAGVK